MDLIDSTQEYLLNYPQKISVWKHEYEVGPATKTVNEIFAELASMKWNHSNDISYLPIEIIDLSKPPITVIDLSE